ncbi:MAG TPA: hypothetical protein DCO86_05075 [Spirochaetaceae bacterium]|nr:hypothetical protein [Spirochaetaceae bacterium]
MGKYNKKNRRRRVEWLSDLKLRYQTAQIKVSVSVNSELIKFYWSLGEDIFSMKKESKWG